MFWSDANYCTLPASATPAINSTNKINGGQICQQPDWLDAVWDDGVLILPIWNVPGQSSNFMQVGTAYAYFTYDLRLYITMTFDCNYLLSTDPNSPLASVEFSLWNTPDFTDKPQ
eukprot:366192-Chlamydomonas_euryale.AAC.3